MSHLLIVMLGLLIVASAVCVAEQRRRHRVAANRLDDLRQHVRRYRYSKMLEYVGADVDEYIRRIAPAELEDHLRRCAACEEVEICDLCLRDGLRVDDMNFCPNYRDLTLESDKFMPVSRGH